MLKTYNIEDIKIKCRARDGVEGWISLTEVGKELFKTIIETLEKSIKEKK